MVIAAATLTSANTYPCLILTKHLIQISFFAIDDTAYNYSTKKTCEYHNPYKNELLNFLFARFLNV